MTTIEDNISYGKNNETIATLIFFHVPENTRHLADGLCDGYCHLDMPDKFHGIFSRHHVKK
jgi:hypothetical protein